MVWLGQLKDRGNHYGLANLNIKKTTVHENYVDEPCFLARKISWTHVSEAKMINLKKLGFSNICLAYALSKMCFER